jgi:hypothetical protein
MKVHIFRGDGRVFGFTRDEAGASLPSGYGDWAAFRSVEMREGDVMPGVEVDECLADIAAHGFHLTDAHVRITDRAIGEETL